jgi:hypothetical protein
MKTVTLAIIAILILNSPVFGESQALYLRIHKIDFKTLAKDYVIENGELKVMYGVSEMAEKKLVRKLSPSELTSLKDFIEHCKLEKLKDTYVNPDVEDGYQVFYNIQFKGHSFKIRTFNVYQPTMISICEKVNALLPKAYKILIPSVAEKHIVLMN